MTLSGSNMICLDGVMLVMDITLYSRGLKGGWIKLLDIFDDK